MASSYFPFGLVQQETSDPISPEAYSPPPDLRSAQALLALGPQANGTGASLSPHSHLGWVVT